MANPNRPARTWGTIGLSDMVLWLLLTGVLLYSAAGLWHLIVPKTKTVPAVSRSVESFPTAQEGQAPCETALELPRRAVHIEADTVYVYISRAGRAKKVSVTVLAECEDAVLVTGSTLQPGDEVIVRAAKLYDGMPIT